MLLDAALVFCAYLLATYIRFDIMYGAAPALQLAWNRRYFEIAAVYAVVLCGGVLRRQAVRLVPFSVSRAGAGGDFYRNAVGVSVLTALLYVTRFADFSRLAIFMFLLFPHCLCLQSASVCVLSCGITASWIITRNM